MPDDHGPDLPTKDVIFLSSSTVFHLHQRLAAKADPDLIGADEQRFADIAATLQSTIADLTERLAYERQAPERDGQAALDRDQAVHRLTARLRTLRRFGIDLCLGRMDRANGEKVYIGRLGLADDDGRRLLVDWRSPAAEPFFGATHADPMGLASRRRYRWTDGRITDYWDEVFLADGLASHAVTLDDQSAFVASLGTSRSPRMRDVLATIQADQDAIIRAGSDDALVVDGGPGTGKTVVALHRAAYLLYADPRLGHHRGGVLFVGPHRRYLAYVGDVLPSLGEDGVRTCTLRDLVPEGATAGAERDADVAWLKSSVDLVRGLETGVRFYEQPPTDSVTVETPWGDLAVGPADWAEAFGAVEPGTPHNEARDRIRAELAELVAERVADASVDEVRLVLDRDRKLSEVLHRAWPLLAATDLIADLWSVPAYLRLCAPWLSRDEIRLLQRADAYAWTAADLPLLDAARHRLGDSDADVRTRRQRASADARRQEFAAIMDDLIAGDDSEMGVMSMLRGADIQDALLAGDAPTVVADALAGPFAHVVVDEAQELTDAQWQQLLQRCPSHSFTVVGDRAQARHGFAESWRERLHRIGLDRISLTSLTVNYRTPSEVMAVAEPVIRAALPDANVPTSIRDTGIPVRFAAVSDRDAVVDDWLARTEDGIACVIGDSSFETRDRVTSLTPELAKGLEFDLVVLVDPEAFGTGIEGAVDRYVAMTRTTRELVVLTH